MTRSKHNFTSYFQKFRKGPFRFISDFFFIKRTQVLNQVWKHVARFKNSADYMSCAEVWVDYVCRHMDFADINTFIAVTIKQMNIDRAYERHQSQLYAIIDRIACNIQVGIHRFEFTEQFSEHSLSRESIQRT